MSESDRNEVRALVIEMRQYFYRKGLLTGECVAWNKLKRLCGTDEDWDAEDAWLAEYRASQRRGHTHRRLQGEGGVDADL